MALHNLKSMMCNCHLWWSDDFRTARCKHSFDQQIYQCLYVGTYQRSISQFSDFFRLLSSSRTERAHCL